MCPDLDTDLHSCTRIRLRAEPATTFHEHLPLLELLSSAQHHLTLLWSDLQDVGGMSEGWKAPALTDGIALETLVATQLSALPVHETPRAQATPLSQQIPVVATGHEADLHALGLLGRKQPGLPGQLPDFLLGEVSQRKQDLGEELALDAEQEVALVLRAIPSAVETAVFQPRVVPSCHRVGRDRCCKLEEMAEFQILVAENTGARRAATPVFRNEVVDQLPELLGVVHGVEGDAQFVRHTSGVPGITG